ncbi:nitroreductase family protein [uncultured Methanobrevibacter sp.]|uniref:nitroreductase family protein n=1 Tax=uncultured Methanobrevibacter sp. TaxID=253161 RepID=UPI002626EF2E|nr:nitroreductase family protein [uncultured Methanobrevibacter sp.]
MNPIFKRRSVRKFNDKEVSMNQVKHLIEAGMQAPSAFNSQPWEFIIVSDKKDLNAVSKMSRYAKPAKKAQKLIIVLGNTKKFKVVKPMIQQDLSACTQNILLQAVIDGLGAVWLGFYPKEDRVNALREYFHIPNHIIPFSVIAIGYPKEDKEPKSRYDESKIHLGKY